MSIYSCKLLELCTIIGDRSGLSKKKFYVHNAGYLLKYISCFNKYIQYEEVYIMEQELVNIIMFKMSDTLDNLQMMKLKKF